MKNKDWPFSTALGALLACIGLNIYLSGHANAMTQDHIGNIAAFSTGSLDGWKERSFAGNTDYRIVRKRGVNVLKGHTQSQASILYREEKINLISTPIVNWSWKVDRTYSDIDEKSTQGDDFPARLYVVAKTGFLPWETLAINYVWASQAARGDAWRNPYTDKAVMIAIESGNDRVGEWTVHSRNVAQDFKDHFGIQIEELSGYAVMVDGDNAQREATGWFGKIAFTKLPE